MARIRSIKPEFFKHLRLYQAEKETGLPLRVAFAGIWTVCDREGRFKWIPETVKLDVLPYDDLDFSRVLDALATRGFLVKYKISGVDYGYIPSWSLHQYINGKEAKSILPIPPQNQEVDACSTCGSRDTDACVTCEPRGGTHSVKEGKGKEGEGNGTRVDDACATERRKCLIDFPKSQNPGPLDDEFDGQEWCLRTYKAYPKGDKTISVPPPVIGDLYQQLIDRESPSHGGKVATAKWLLGLVQQYAAATKPQFVTAFEKFLRSGYSNVQSEGAADGSGPVVEVVSFHSDAPSMLDRIKANPDKYPDWMKPQSMRKAAV